MPRELCNVRLQWQPGLRREGGRPRWLPSTCSWLRPEEWFGRRTRSCRASPYERTRLGGTLWTPEPCPAWPGA
eukprot:8521425-Lingulodinium_polyedra.AAC.1